LKNLTDTDEEKKFIRAKAALTGGCPGYSCACDNALHLYADPGGLDTGVIGIITAPGLVCNDGADECAGTHSCTAAGQNCINTIGTYECGCDTGYACNSALCNICDDVDECLTPALYCFNQFNCGDPGILQCSTCSNTIGSYECNCPDGWKHDTDEQAEFGCIHDEDECVLDATICNENGDGFGNPAPGRIFAICTNTVGSYDCECDTGYGLTADDDCEDVDECVETDPALVHSCDPNATCQNTAGSFTCSCNVGFTDDKDGDGISDTDGRLCWTIVNAVTG